MKVRSLFSAFLLLASMLPSMAWGPHPQITGAALSVLDAKDPLSEFLGPNLDRLKSYCGMGDMYEKPMTELDGSVYYANDYLLHQALPMFSAHTCPGVNKSFETHFRRAVQALRTESPLNAARWTGTLLHFTEDPGAPPHALPGMGALHGPMEGWVDSTKIIITGYQPKLLGSTEDEAVAGYIKRMEELVAFSKIRGERLKPLAAANNRPACEPIELESALESSRVSADVLYTLGRIALSPVPGSCVLSGTINPSHPNEPGVPCAKVVLLGTNYSTVVDPSGKFEFRNLPAGKYEGRVIKTGYKLGRFSADLTGGGVRVINLALRNAVPAGNLVLNGDFSLRWVTQERPDGWYPRKDGLDTSVMPVKAGQKYIIVAGWKPGATPSIVIRWSSRVTTNAKYFLRTEETPAGQKEYVCTVPENAQGMQLLVKTATPIETVCDGVSVVVAR